MNLGSSGIENKENDSQRLIGYTRPAQVLFQWSLICYLQLIHGGKGKVSFLPMTCHRVYQPHPRAGLSLGVAGNTERLMFGLSPACWFPSMQSSTEVFPVSPVPVHTSSCNLSHQRPLVLSTSLEACCHYKLPSLPTSVTTRWLKAT